MLSFCAPARKYAAHDRWIGWDLRHQYDRLHLVANNARFLILPGHHYPNLASRVLSLCERGLGQDWRERFCHPLWLLETFIDPRYFRGAIYSAANWEYVGDTRGFRCTLRTGHGPENITRLRRFAIGLIKSKSRNSVAATIAKLARNVRLVFDSLRITDNSIPGPRTLCTHSV